MFVSGCGNINNGRYEYVTALNGVAVGRKINGAAGLYTLKENELSIIQNWRSSELRFVFFGFF